MASISTGWLPSIWQARIECAADWEAAREAFARFDAVADTLDDAVLRSRHPFTLNAWCVACHTVQPLRMNWALGAVTGGGSVHPAWTETALCPGCGLNSRMRAVIDLLERLDERDGFPARVYVAERLTPAYRVLATRYPNLVGSEYLDPALTSGIEVEHGPEALHVRHEDLTRLSFEDATFDRVVTMEVFEHVPAYRAALHACRRVLRPHGSLIFTVPFFPEQRTTEVRATVANDGTIIHHLPAEYHGDPVRVEAGALCFQHFGWDLLDDLHAVGFATATANLYWGPWQGHLGRPYFVFEARVAETGSA